MNLFEFLIHPDNVYSIVFTPDGQKLVSGCHDCNVRVWSLDRQNLAVLKGHYHHVASVDVSPDGLEIVSGSCSGIIRIWDLESGECRNILKGHQGSIFAVQFCPCGDKIVSSGHDGFLKIWDATSGECLRMVDVGKDSGGLLWIGRVAIAPNGRSLVFSSAKDSAHIHEWVLNILDLNTGKYIKTTETHLGRIHAVEISQDGEYIVSAAEDMAIKVWDFQGHCLNTLIGNSNPVFSVCVTPDNTRIISGSGDFLHKLHPIDIWDLQSGQNLKTLEGHTRSINSIVVHPDEVRFATSSRDCTVKLWDLETGDCLEIF